MAFKSRRVEMGSSPTEWVPVDSNAGKRSISMVYAGVEAFYSVTGTGADASGSIVAESPFPPEGFRVHADLAADEVMWARGRGHVVVDGG